MSILRKNCSKEQKAKEKLEQKERMKAVRRNQSQELKEKGKAQVDP